ncbi:hypothetical protein T484DRAFT_2280520 [Baffinella frigidus]|nr:hypothetical protein T484DRAFT_2280520 [Cryptophyta sp. CCMP2293]
MVISLLDPKRGWPTPEKQEWEDWDVDFVVIKPESAQQVAADVQRAVRAHLAKQPKRMVAIYCEDGCNLSGYAIVSYMHTAVAMPLQDALKAFADARPPGIFHPEYLDDLWKRLGGASAPPPPSKPEWASDGAHLVHAKGAFSMPMPQLPQLPQIQPVPASGGGASKGGEGAEEKLPAGWSQHFSKTHCANLPSQPTSESEQPNTILTPIPCQG